MLNNSQLASSSDYAAGIDGSGLDLSLYCDRMRAELMRQLDQRGNMEIFLSKLSKEKVFLDDQLHDTITSYTGVIQVLQDQVSKAE